jgi:hypothetical protein
MTSLRRAPALLAVAAAAGLAFPARPVRSQTGGAGSHALIGYVDASDPARAKILHLAGGWHAGRGWVPPPESAFSLGWNASDWQLFSLPGAEPTAVHSRPFLSPGHADPKPYYDLPDAARTGIAVSGGARLLPRKPTRESTDQDELKEATRDLLKQEGVPSPKARIQEVWRVDLNGDGTDELLWTARSREEWRSNSRKDGSSGPRPNDYSLVGVRYLRGDRVRFVALALATERAGVTWHHLFCPLDLNGDGQMEIVAHAKYQEGEDLLVFTFDGSTVAGVLGTRPSEPGANGPS